MNRTTKKFTLFVLLIHCILMRAQDIDITPYLAFGQEAAQTLGSEYTSPFSESLMYGLAGGWSNSAVVNDAWKVELSVKFNGSIIPSSSKTFEVDVADFDNLEIVGGANRIRIPTIFGPKNSAVRLAVVVDEGRVEFDVPTGIGLTNLNLMPNAAIQGELGLGFNTEFKLRFVPKLTLDETDVTLVGVGLQHQFSEWIEVLRDSKIALSTSLSYTNFSALYEFESSGFVSGTNQEMDVRMRSWLFDFIASTKSPVFNVYCALGYVIGDSDIKLNGRYNVMLLSETIQFRDPLNIDRDVYGLRFSIGGQIRLARWVSINGDYTVQGFNNISLGLNFKFG